MLNCLKISPGKKANFLYDNIAYIIIGLALLLVILLMVPSIREAIFEKVTIIFDKMRFGL